MSNLTIPEKEVKVIRECDVLVLGAGMSGFAAALASSRAGAKTTLVDKNHFPGGVATSGLMYSISNFFVTEEGINVNTGIPIEFIDRIVAEGGAEPDYLRIKQPQIPNVPEITKRVMIKMLRESDVTTLYGSMLIDVITNEGKVTHCIFQGRDNTFAIRAKQFVDASGDLSIFRRAGGEYEEREDRETLLYRMANVDVDKIIDWFEENPDSYSPQADIPTSLEDTIRNWREYGVFHLPHFGGGNISIVKEAVETGKYKNTFGKHYSDLDSFGMFSCRADHGNVLINSNFSYGECYDILLESEREDEGRLLIEEQVEFLTKYFPGFENAYLLESACEIGHRTSRRATCERLYTEDEFSDGVKMQDCIGVISERDKRTKPIKRLKKLGQLPLSMVISRKTPNVVVGSAKNPYTEVWGMIRGQAGCLVMGQGAGVSAAIAAITGKDVVNVNIRKVQEELIKQGVKIPHIC